jgi:hypothetical protein
MPSFSSFSSSFSAVTRKRSAIAVGILSLAGVVSAIAITLPNTAPAPSRSAPTAYSVSGRTVAHDDARISSREASAAKLAEAKLAATEAHKATATEARKATAATTAHQAAATVPSGSPQQVTKGMLTQFGWSASQFSCLDPLWAHESGWSITASNPSTGAYGIPQALPGSKMASAGPDWRASAATQVKWGLEYIQGTYGSPCGAWSHEESDGWY